MIKKINYLLFTLISIIYYSCVEQEHKVDVLTVPKIKSNDSLLIEQWAIIGGGYAMDTFINCKYNYLVDSTLIINFGSSKVWNHFLQIELINKDLGIYYSIPSLKDGFVSPVNGVEFLDSFHIETRFIEDSLFVKLEYKYSLYGLVFNKQKWYHRFFPYANTYRIQHSISDNCICKKSNEKIYSKSHKEDFKYMNYD